MHEILGGIVVELNFVKILGFFTCLKIQRIKLTRLLYKLNDIMDLVLGHHLKNSLRICVFQKVTCIENCELTIVSKNLKKYSSQEEDQWNCCVTNPILLDLLKC